MGAGALGLFGGLASTGLSMYGQLQQGKASMQAARYNAEQLRRQADYNNRLAEAEASNRERESSEAIRRARINNEATLSELRARLGASGVRLTTGTPLAVMGEAAGRLELSIADASRTAMMQAASMRAQGKMGLWQAEQAGTMALFEGRLAKQSSLLKAGATAFGGIGSAYGKFREGSYQGLFPRID